VSVSHAEQYFWWHSESTGLG